LSGHPAGQGSFKPQGKAPGLNEPLIIAHRLQPN
jgi:hypothetical protein